MDLMEEVIEQFQSIYNKSLDVLEQQTSDGLLPGNQLYTLYHAYWASNQKLQSTLQLLRAVQNQGRK
ncbi:hypothetical protein ACFPPD_07040 [Cohnella suwonensis]|uniref:DUF2524 domain-containing protein n=1 Tax=Cohnella suwonensis TaxID=696072 RepID=A0ABW0LRE0_9BACL